MTSNRWMLAVAALAAGCASGAPATAPDRALFRLATSGVAPVVAADEVPADSAVVREVPAPPPGATIAAYTASIRLTRGDGTTLTAPTVTTYAGQRANIQIVKDVSFIQDFDVTSTPEGDAWIADPIVGTLRTGWFFDVTMLDAAGLPGEAALAFSVKGSDVRRPIATRTIDLHSPRSGRPVTIQMPRVESVEVTGARRIALGTEFEIARVPEPSGHGELTLCATVVRVLVPRPDDPAGHDLAEDDDAEPAAAAAQVTLRSLGGAAASGARPGALRVTAIRMPAGAAGPDAPGVERLGTLAVDSVIAPGATMSDRLTEAFLSQYDVAVEESTGHAACDPVVGTQDSGLTVTAVGDAALRIAWRTTPRFESVAEAPFASNGFYSHLTGRADSAFRFVLDKPQSVAVERTIPLTRGRSVHPVFNLPDGGTAALVIDYDAGP